MKHCCSLNYIPIAQILEADKEKMLIELRTCEYEVGIETDAHRFFESLRDKYGNMYIPVKILLDIVAQNISDAHVLEGVLHTLSWYEYTEMDFWDIECLLCFCTSSQASLVQEGIIFLVEEWEEPEFISILKLLKIKEDWLIKYRDDVIRGLENVG